MLVVGLTGGIASGKSSVSKILHSHGIPIIDLDILAREAVLPNTSAFKKIASTFPSVIDTSTSPPSLNRGLLGSIIFKDENKRKILNKIVHPQVRKLLFWKILKNWLKGEKILIVDAPLLIEAGLWRLCGAIVLVYCKKEQQLERLKKRNPELNDDQVRDRVEAQMALEDKRRYADWVVENEGGVAELEGEVKRVLQGLSKNIGGVGWAVCWLIPPVGAVWALGKVIYRLSWKKVGRKSKKE